MLHAQNSSRLHIESSGCVSELRNAKLRTRARRVFAVGTFSVLMMYCIPLCKNTVLTWLNCMYSILFWVYEL